jgi:hypothetical protein
MIEKKLHGIIMFATLFATFSADLFSQRKERKVHWHKLSLTSDQLNGHDLCLQ